MRRINEIETKNSIVSALIAIILFFSLIMFLKFSLIVSILISTVSYVAVYFIIKPNTNLNDYKEMLSEDEYKRFDEIMNDGSNKIKMLEQYKAQIKNLTTRDKLAEIIETSKRILEQVEKNPQKIKYAKKFISYYLPSVVSIVDDYIKISNTNEFIQTEQLKNSIVKVNKALDNISTAFKNHFVKLMQNEVMDIDVEVDLLEKTIHSEGM